MIDCPNIEMVWEAPKEMHQWTDSEIDEVAYRMLLKQELEFQKRFKEFLDENELSPDLTAKVCIRFALFYYYSMQIPFEAVVDYQIKPEWKNIEKVNPR